MIADLAGVVCQLPIAIRFGRGSHGRRPLGLCLGGGFPLSAIPPLYLTPVIYVYLDRFTPKGTDLPAMPETR